MIGFDGKTIPPGIQSFIEQNHIGFIILFSRNIESYSQVKNLTDHIHSLGSSPPLIYTDQEGGTVVRFDEMAATVVSPMGIAATGSPDNAETAGRLIGEDMFKCGIDGVFAPVLDVNTEENNPVIGVRSFSDNPETVIQYADAFRKGLNKAGILSCGKHYPGHGAASADSHLEIPEIRVSQSFFMQYCLAPFTELARKGIDSILTAHVRYPEIRPEICTFSEYMVNDLLRKQNGFNRVVFTDCLEMKAIKDNYIPEEIVRNVISAGLDVMIPSHSFDFQEELLDVLRVYVRKGIISENRLDESIARIDKLRERAKELQKEQSRIRKEVTATPLRMNIAQEKRIADESITIIKNSSGLIPLKKEKRTLILEWSRRVWGPSAADHSIRSMIEETSGIYFENRDYVLLKPDQALPEDLVDRIKTNKEDYDYVLVFIYSRTGKLNTSQTESVRHLLSIRRDAVVISLENPYEVKKFPEADSFLVTYGFRKIQIEALFNVITGGMVPMSRLPVTIKNIKEENER